MNKPVRFRWSYTFLYIDRTRCVLLTDVLPELAALSPDGAVAALFTAGVFPVTLLAKEFVVGGDFQQEAHVGEVKFRLWSQIVLFHVSTLIVFNVND